MVHAQKHLVGWLTVMLLVAQWSVVQHVLSHIDRGDATHATHQAASCADCAGSMPLLASQGSHALVPITLDPTTEADARDPAAASIPLLPPTHYRSRAPPG